MRARRPDGVGEQDQLELSFEPLAVRRSPGRLALPWRRRLLSLALMCLAASVSAAVLLSALHTLGAASSSTPAPDSARTLQSISRSGAVPSTTPPGTGWTRAGPDDAQTIAFAPSEPLTAYTCGAPLLTQPNASSAIDVGVSHDAGHSWRTLPTPAIAVACDVTVDPLNALDIMLSADPCPYCTAPPSAIRLYRSFDGGSTWSAWALPPRGSGGQRDFSAYQWAWAGSTLFLAPYMGDADGWTRLAASVSGAPFVWVDGGGLFAGTASDAGIDGLYVHGASLYVSLSFRQSCPPTCTMARQTSDNGVSWSAFTPSIRGYPVYLLGTSVDATMLFGHYFASDSVAGGTYVLSGDGGATWRTMPAFPGAQVADRILAAPDGTIFAEVDVSPSPPAGSSGVPPGVYTFPPAASAWVFVAGYPGNPSGPIMVAWDAGGHPVALWGGAYQQLYPDGLRAGMELHLP